MYRSTCIDTDMNGLIPVFLCVLGSDWFPPFRDHTDAISFIYRFRCIFMYIDTVMDGLVSFFCLGVSWLDRSVLCRRGFGPALNS